ncbi:unnamed protein product [Oikopleura dioica]|uniref:Uncharacterized protein n=1 Tax=Oikopleura dioica TaxID=34765 RepID=E4X2E8_OIKDI|nr:unnamed protein product [Oikopleura dioica]
MNDLFKSKYQILLRKAVSRKSEETAHLSLSRFLRKYKSGSELKVVKINFHEVADASPTILKENDLMLIASQRRWWELDEAVKHMSPAPRNKFNMDSEIAIELQKSWLDLMGREPTPAGQVRVDITMFLNEDELTELINWLQGLNETEKTLSNATKRLASRWLKKTKANGRYLVKDSEIEEKLLEEGQNMRKNTTTEQITKLKRLAALIGLNPKSEFWPDLTFWLRRVYDTMKNWAIELTRNKNKLPADLFFQDDGLDFLSNLKMLNEPEQETIPSLLLTAGENQGNLFVVSNDPLKMAKIYTGFNEEILRKQKFMLREVSQETELEEELKTLLRRYLAEEEVDANGQTWIEVKEFLRNARGSTIKDLTKEHEYVLWETLLKNLNEIMTEIKEEGEETLEVRRWRTILGWTHISLNETVFEEIPVPNQEEIYPQDMTTEIHLAESMQLFKDKLADNSICAIKGCENLAGNLPICPWHLNILPLMMTEDRNSRFTKSCLNRLDKFLAKERWQKSSYLSDLHPSYRAKIFANILKIHSTSNFEVGIEEALAAIACDLYRTGTQKCWGTKDLIDNENLTSTMQKVADNFNEMRKAKYWKSLQVQKKGKVILIPLLKVENNGERTYGKAMAVTIEDGEISAKDLMEVVNDPSEKWSKFRRSMPFKPKEFTTKFKKEAKSARKPGEEFNELNYLKHIGQTAIHLELMVVCENQLYFTEAVEHLVWEIRNCQRRKIWVDRRAQIVNLTEVKGIGSMEYFDGSDLKTSFLLRPQGKKMRSGVPRDATDKGDETIINFLGHLAVAKNLDKKFHPENIMGPTTWCVEGSDMGAFFRRQEKSVALLAVLMSHWEEEKLGFWRIEDAEILFRDGTFNNERIPHEEAVNDMLRSDTPRVTQAEEVMFEWERVEGRTITSGFLVDSANKYLQPDARMGKRICKRIMKDFNRFTNIGIRWRKRAILPWIQMYFRDRSLLRHKAFWPVPEEKKGKVPSLTWHRLQRTTFKTERCGGYLIAGSDTECSDYSDNSDNSEDEEEKETVSTKQKKQAEQLFKKETIDPDIAQRKVVRNVSKDSLSSVEDEELQITDLERRIRHINLDWGTTGSVHPVTRRKRIPVATPTTKPEVEEAEEINQHWWNKLNFDSDGKPRPDGEFFMRLKKRRALDLIKGSLKYNPRNEEEKKKVEEEKKKALEFLKELDSQDFSEDEAPKSNGQNKVAKEKNTVEMQNSTKSNGHERTNENESSTDKKIPEKPETETQKADSDKETESRQKEPEAEKIKKMSDTDSERLMIYEESETGSTSGTENMDERREPRFDPADLPDDYDWEDDPAPRGQEVNDLNPEEQQLVNRAEEEILGEVDNGDFTDRETSLKMEAEHPKMKDRETRQKYPMDVKVNEKEVQSFLERAWDQEALHSGRKPLKRTRKEKSNGRDRGINNSLPRLEEDNPFGFERDPEAALNEYIALRNLGKSDENDPKLAKIPRKSSDRKVNFGEGQNKEIKEETVLSTSIKEAAKDYEYDEEELTVNQGPSEIPAGLKPIKRQKFGEMRELSKLTWKKQRQLERDAMKGPKYQGLKALQRMGIYSDWQIKKEHQVQQTWRPSKIARIEEILTLLCVKFGTSLCSQRDLELAQGDLARMAIQDGAQLTFHLDRMSRDNGMFNRTIIRMSIFKGLQLINRLVLECVEISKLIINYKGEVRSWYEKFHPNEDQDGNY